MKSPFQHVRAGERVRRQARRLTSPFFSRRSGSIPPFSTRRTASESVNTYRRRLARLRHCCCNERGITALSPLHDFMNIEETKNALREWYGSDDWTDSCTINFLLRPNPTLDRASEQIGHLFAIFDKKYHKRRWLEVPSFQRIGGLFVFEIGNEGYLHAHGCGRFPAGYRQKVIENADAIWKKKFVASGSIEFGTLYEPTGWIDYCLKGDDPRLLSSPLYVAQFHSPSQLDGRCLA